MDESKKQSIIAFVRLTCMFISSGLALFSVYVDADALFVGAICVIAVIAFIWGWWKNNNVTDGATEAQKVLDNLKGKTEEVK